MSESIFDVTMVEMPSVLPVLPFAGTFLFPGQKLQLRIFETRYIRLIFNALASSRIVGMVQPVDKVSTEDKPKLYSVGCAGRISGDSAISAIVLATFITLLLARGERCSVS